MTNSSLKFAAFFKIYFTTSSQINGFLELTILVLQSIFLNFIYIIMIIPILISMSTRNLFQSVFACY